MAEFSHRYSCEHESTGSVFASQCTAGVNHLVKLKKQINLKMDTGVDCTAYGIEPCSNSFEFLITRKYSYENLRHMDRFYVPSMSISWEKLIPFDVSFTVTERDESMSLTGVDVIFDRWVRALKTQTSVATCNCTEAAAGNVCGLLSRTRSCIHSKPERWDRLYSKRAQYKS